MPHILRRIPPATILLASVIALLLTAAPATAGPGGINLSWVDCGTFGAVNKSFSCNSNAGVALLIGSFIPPDDGQGGPAITALTGEEVVLDFHVNSATVPPWWQFKNPGSCRAASATADLVFGPNCVDYYATAASPAIAFTEYVTGIGGTNSARARIFTAVSEASAGPVDPTLEYYSFRFRIDYRKTVGPGSCSGCQNGACIVLNQIGLRQPHDGLHSDRVLYNPLDHQHVTWQAGVGLLCPPCVNCDPIRDKTWGSIKSLYR